MKYILFLTTTLYILSCHEKEKKQTLKDKQSEIETGSLDSTNKYVSDEIGWTTTIPKDWEVLTKEETGKLNERGEKEIEKTMNADVDVSGLKELINLKKDNFNFFGSTIERFQESESGSYTENNKNAYEIIKQTYAGKGMDASYQEDSAKIDGLNFNIFKVKIYDQNKSKVIIYQVMYSRLINGYDFAMTIIYNNEESLKELREMVFSSKFSKRD